MGNQLRIVSNFFFFFSAAVFIITKHFYIRSFLFNSVDIS